MAFCHFLAIFDPMKKWMITYVFLFGFLSLTLCGHAAPAKTFIVHSSSKLIAKKISPLPGQHKNNEQKDFYTTHFHTRIPFSIIPPFSLAENVNIISSQDFITQIVITPEPERVLKDHLQHLFPSHYFW